MLGHRLAGAVGDVQREEVAERAGRAGDRQRVSLLAVRGLPAAAELADARHGEGSRAYVRDLVRPGRKHEADVRRALARRARDRVAVRVVLCGGGVEWTELVGDVDPREIGVDVGAQPRRERGTRVDHTPPVAGIWYGDHRARVIPGWTSPLDGAGGPPLVAPRSHRRRVAGRVVRHVPRAATRCHRDRDDVPERPSHGSLLA